MEKEVTRLYLNDMTQQKMYKYFGLKRIDIIQELEDWLSHLPDLNEGELFITNHYKSRLLKNIDSWNEQELSLGFIGPIVNIIDFKVPYELNFFAQRPIAAIIGEYELYGKPDGMLASGNFEPELPYFAFQEYKKDVNSSGDPAGQNLAAMLAGQVLNKTEDTIYGCYIVGRNWYFMVLKGNKFAISKSFSADDEEILDIVKTLKALQAILFKNLGITEH